MTPSVAKRCVGRLYVVATPIGNLQDLCTRGIEVLRQVDRIACEDTRHSGKLLSHFGIKTPTISYHDHNEEERAGQLLQRLLRGESLALVSDAGTPVVSDPGYRLVRAARIACVPVIPIPGPSAAVAALSISGLPSDQFLFLGFLPKKKSAQRQGLEAVRPLAPTLICYLSPHRLKEQLTVIREVLGDRLALLAREMTKLHEQTYWGPLSDIERALEEAGTPRGEVTLVVAGLSKAAIRPAAIDMEAYLAGLISHRGLSRSQASSQAAKELNRSKRELYRLSLT